MSTPGDNPAGDPGATPDGPTIYCPKCEYNLTGLTRDVCPECGTPFDPVVLRWQALNVKPRWKRILPTLIFYSPCAALLLPVYLEFVFAKAGDWIWKSDPTGRAITTWALIVAAWAMYMAQHRGCRIARRNARRLPTDPATPTTLGNMAFYGLLLFLKQLGVAFLVLAVFSRTVSEMFPMQVDWAVRFGGAEFGFRADDRSTGVSFGPFDLQFPLNSYASMAIFVGLFMLFRRGALAIFRRMTKAA